MDDSQEDIMKRLWLKLSVACFAFSGAIGFAGVFVERGAGIGTVVIIGLIFGGAAGFIIGGE